MAASPVFPPSFPLTSSRKRAGDPLESPAQRPRESSFETKLKAFIEAIQAFERAALIVTQPRTRGESGSRPVCATYTTFRIPGRVTDPFKGHSSYLLSNGANLDGQILQDWMSNPPAVDDLLKIEVDGIFPARVILEALYGADFSLVVDRRSQSTPEDKQSIKKREALCHVDFPKWLKKPRWECPPLTNVYLEPDHITIIAIDQGKPHSVPASAGDADGLYVGALPREQRKIYNESTASYLEEKRKKPLTKNQHFLPFEAYAGMPECNAMIQAGCLLTGCRPIKFPSFKTIQMPQPFNGNRYKYFLGYGLPDQSKHDLNEVLACIRAKHGDLIAIVFENAAADLGLGPRCACDPSGYETYTLLRFFEWTQSQ